MEEQVIYKCMQALEEKTTLKSRWFVSVKDTGIDGKIEIKNVQQKFAFPSIVKKEVKSIHLVTFLQNKEQQQDLIILAEIMYPAIREQLRKMGINYIDGFGNCFIKRDEWYVLSEGFKGDITPNIVKERAFTKTGLLLVFHFLCDEKYIGVTYRQMAKDYQISLGNINNVISSLKEQGYITQINKTDIRLTNKSELLDEWIAGYQQKLKPSLFMGAFRLLGGNDKEWQKIPIKNTETQWGGEPAGYLLTGYLRPGKLTLYTQETKAQLIKKYRLIPDEKGKLELYKKFWKFQQTMETVPPILVYADLINSGDPRNIETAKKLHDGLLKDQL